METKIKSLGLKTKISVGVLTSLRADFGIYYPLLKKMDGHEYFDLEIIAFGTHLDENYGKTINEIYSSGFKVKHQIETLTLNNNPYETSKSISNTMSKFSDFWNNNRFD